MDAIDNPSYFSFPSEAQKKCKSNFIRRWNENRSSATLPANASSKKNTSSSGPKRNFRSLLRANSADTHLLVQGKPRPSDLAPSVYSIKHQRHRSIGNVIGSNDLLHQDMVHCGGVGNDDGDVFLSDATINSQYYNLMGSSPQRILTPGRRRHSIGSFLNRDRSFSAGRNDENLNRESSIRRKFKRITIEKAHKMEDELDVLLISCGENETSLTWGNYLITCFQQISKDRNIPSFKLHSVKLEDIVAPLLENGTIDKYPEARVQIVVVCPKFMEKIQSIPEAETSLGKLFRPEKVVALMLGLGVQEQWDNNHIRTVIPKYELWRKMTVKDVDRISVEDFLGVAMDILSKSRQIQEALNLEQQQTHFSIMPKKIKVGQNRILVLLNEPITVKDDIKITIDKNGQHLDVGTVKRRNPYTLQFSVPASCFQISMLVFVCVEKNGKNLGRRQVKCESKMRELDQIIRTLENPINFMCQSFNLNMNDKDQLDTFLCNVFQKNVPPHFHLLNPCIPIDKTTTSNEEFPTLLHFTAKYGLEKLSWVLMESPGCEQACHIRNCSQMTPSEIAERANHTQLSKILKDFKHMAELSNVYNYVKNMNSDTSENNYMLPRPVDDTYLIPPAARPVDPSLMPPPIADSPNSPSGSTSDPYYMNFKRGHVPSMVNTPVSPTSINSLTSFQNYEVPPTARPCTPYTPNSPTSPIGKKFEGYLEMNPIEKELNNFGSVSSFNTNSEFPENFGSFNKLDTCEGVSSPTDSTATSKYSSASHLLSREKVSPDDELLEIINDFKHDVLTINEVEALVEKWQNRNDVQQSFKDRQDQLDKMREEYDRIQRKMKEHMKSTPLEKIRRFFSRGKSKRRNSRDRASSFESDMLTAFKAASSNISIQSSSSSASSRTNSISNGSGGNNDGGQRQYDRTRLSLEKLNPKKKKFNHYVEIPASVAKPVEAADNSEYVQPDNVPPTSHNNRLSSCSSSVVNDTIHECIESDNMESCSNSNANLEIRRNTYHSNGTVLKNYKSLDHFRTNSLRLESKKKSKNAQNKVKSAENLICDREWVKNNKNGERTAPNSDTSSEATSKPSGTASCQILCAQTIQCLSGLTNDEAQNDDMPTSSDLTFQFDKEPDDNESSTLSECGSVDSRQNSSLDLSSLSLNSNCTVDENGDIKCSLEFKITEEGEMETEDAPSILSMDHQCAKMCASLPEYANVTMQNSPTIPRRCGYTVVSS
ncbi:phosphoinositide 3-kinase adapter protein 1-like isoform X2 [Planococcus citri]|uniref:phosphoinositide 3-kinase adapter protein 1-like isoform X2 n=1 Tax=Planococcus citri TaxID=170843 RepID=UPI0031FA07DC